MDNKFQWAYVFAKLLPIEKLLDWKSLSLQMSPGWLLLNFLLFDAMCLSTPHDFADVV